MRTLTIAVLALAASVSLSGLARADETVSRENAESVAVAAQSWQEASQKHHNAATTTLGYSAPASQRAQQIESIFAQPEHQSTDSLFMEQGDRGLGTN